MPLRGSLSFPRLGPDIFGLVFILFGSWLGTHPMCVGSTLARTESSATLTHYAVVTTGRGVGAPIPSAPLAPKVTGWGWGVAPALAVGLLATGLNCRHVGAQLRPPPYSLNPRYAGRTTHTH